MEKSKMRLAVAGCGQVFERYHMPAIQRSLAWELVAICDTSPERRAWFQSRNDRVAVLESLPELLERVEVDAVLITTTPACHCTLTIYALKKGVAVLVEKPMALNIRDARAMLDASQQNQKPLWVGFNRRFWRSYRYLKKRAKNLSCECLQTIRYRLISAGHMRQTVTPYLGNDALGGGVLDDLVSHQVDLLFWLIDQPVDALKVERMISSDNGLENIHYQIKWQDGLIIRCEAGRGPNYSESIEIGGKLNRIIGPHGVSRRWMLAGWTHPYRKVKAKCQAILRGWTARPTMVEASFDRELDAFAAAVRGEGGGLDGADAASGVRAVQAVAACRKSLEANGSWVSLTGE